MKSASNTAIERAASGLVVLQIRQIYCDVYCGNRNWYVNRARTNFTLYLPTQINGVIVGKSSKYVQLENQVEKSGDIGRSSSELLPLKCMSANQTGEIVNRKIEKQCIRVLENESFRGVIKNRC